MIGTGLLWVGWFGFNGGSALAANSRAVMAITATHLAACAGALTWGAIEWATRRKPSVLGMISGAIAGLGTITPASGFVAPWHGVVIGVLQADLQGPDVAGVQRPREVFGEARRLQGRRRDQIQTAARGFPAAVAARRGSGAQPDLPA